MKSHEKSLFVAGSKPPTDRFSHYMSSIPSSKLSRPLLQGAHRCGANGSNGSNGPARQRHLENHGVWAALGYTQK